AYLDFRGEVETTQLVLDALAMGKRVIVPVCNPDKTITPKEIRNLTEDLESGTWGIREARVECPEIDPAEIDLVLVPGVGFDQQGNRLGYGAGYYDRFIPRLRQNVPLVALAFEAQILPDITPDPHDHPMDLVVTEERIIHCRKNNLAEGG
ncbi:MAG TPA: 5-formyltetrahydrofolate cyclo-ligase, partial [Verrucomicrobiae bacterium]|nr:5-formyltetrahydrofolate cyclo-ligase [Verrucomicrobiae bacterium]